MKKSKRIFCMLLAAVMLLGVVPAYAAASMSPLAALLAIPVSGQLLNAGPVSDSISKAIAVEKPAAAYSPETNNAPASAPAPVEQTTFSAAPGRLPDGTTGVTVGTAGIVSGKGTELFGSSAVKGPYHAGNRKDIHPLKNCKDKTLTDPSCCDASKTIFCYIDTSKGTPADLVGVILPADMTFDVFTYDPNTRVYTFLCQYDTHGTGAFTITQVPSVWASKPKEAPAPVRTSFNDVKSGDWYYEAVTALAQGGAIHTVFDTDPNGNFNPNALVKDSEIDFIKKRVLWGTETEGLVMNASLDKVETKTGYEPTDEFNALTTSSTRDRVLRSILQSRNSLVAKPAAPAQLDTRQTDREAIAKFVEYYVSTKTNRSHWNESAEKCRALVQEEYAEADALNLIRTPGTPDVIDFDARITRAEYCVLLYRAGLTSFGCAAPKK